MANANHNRLVLAVEIAPPARPSLNRVLDLAGCERLLACIAADLAAITDRIVGTRLIGAGALLSPAELLRPGLPAWAALDDLAARAWAGRPFASELLSIGAANGKFPDDRLMPRAGPPGALLLGLPMTAYSETPDPALNETLESVLFERGGSRPPVHAELAGQCGDGIVHAHVLTVADLLAMYRMQLEQAGLGTPARMLQAAVAGDPGTPPAAGDEDLEFCRQGETLRLTYLAPGEWEARNRSSPGDYLTWLRHFRLAVAVLEDHGVDYRITSGLPRHPDADNILVETLDGHYGTDRLIRHESPELGAIGWTRIDADRRINYWPLDNRAAAWLKQNLESDETTCGHVEARLCYDNHNRLNFVLDEKEEESRSLR